ncbi:energy transducer TonB [Sphingomonas sp. KC8]|uniref:energy transducer TonB n=1 Tax=Sphingomonas sp. KC8 TaxID=1030157 RepID=UPI000248A07C|nr:energy transducer TonB [Sphingomonas sp. KC8]ARS27684.1 hypothetical protein KC8_10315 [Sphingomonas sp. KC8]
MAVQVADQAAPGRHNGRLAATIGVVLVHGLLGYALIAGLNVRMVPVLADTLKMFDVRETPPPPPTEEPPAMQRAHQGAAAPPNKKAVAKPIVAPPPVVRVDVPRPIAAAPVPAAGSAAIAGAAIADGPGSGSGGAGTGTGSGGSGTGAGGGTGAVLIAGRIRDSDYPRDASKARAGGTVIVRFAVGTDGRASGCKVTTSSGHADLDSTTCRLIEQRFRYQPARDGQGRPVADVKGWKQTWWLEPR